MNNQNANRPQTGNDSQTQPAGNSNATEPVQISLPHNEGIQTGPFEHSGETSRQTEEARIEEAEKKNEESTGVA